MNKIFKVATVPHGVSQYSYMKIVLSSYKKRFVLLLTKKAVQVSFYW